MCVFSPFSSSSRGFPQRLSSCSLSTINDEREEKTRWSSCKSRGIIASSAAKNQLNCNEREREDERVRVKSKGPKCDQKNRAGEYGVRRQKQTKMKWTMESWTKTILSHRVRDPFPEQGRERVPSWRKVLPGARIYILTHLRRVSNQKPL